MLVGKDGVGNAWEGAQALENAKKVVDAPSLNVPLHCRIEMRTKSRNGSLENSIVD
jgi:hypothetical protein